MLLIEYGVLAVEFEEVGFGDSKSGSYLRTAFLYISFFGEGVERASNS